MEYSLRREPWWNAVKRARSTRARAASQDAAVVPCVCRRSASPFYLREDKSKWRVVNREERFSQFAPGPTRNSDADRVVRTGSLAPSAPAKRGSICVGSQAYIGALGCQVRSSLTRVFARTTSFLATAMRATFGGFPLSMSRL